MNLPLTCSVIRSTAGAKRDGLPGTTTWAAVSTLVPCRLDFVFRNRTRIEEVTEEAVGRNHGILFTNQDSGIQARDIIIAASTSGTHYNGKQYDVESVDEVLNSIGVHHLEITISLRDNNVTVT